ncbi:nucleotidyl transferase AbiEii/AbiGii toxin family protein [Ferrimicrobium sp.]|uniref:nucleotidyl transferase AbiEii/AbiGii toxin family protein n=1 Tax=Ferrimicrobium sp. TaxID=2926050 RepID=UPI0026327721|nr:nucleotidyl transferase AbiEii/AbiGii toxin family protein [Ferrimicrobium sp.]
MRGLDQRHYARVRAIYEAQTVRLSAAMLEKDILVRDAVLAVKDVGKDEGCRLVFCDVTSLSQAHQLIERMSEDADFRIVIPEGLSHGQSRKLLSAVKTEIATLLGDAHLRYHEGGQSTV